jgi:hypothetical protein
LLGQARRRRPPRPGWSSMLRTVSTSWPMMLRGSPASPCSRSKGCARRPAAATTPSNKQSGLSSETDSGRSGFCGGAATNWNTRTCPQIQPPRRKPSRQPGQRTVLSPSRAGYCRSWPSSAKPGVRRPPQELRHGIVHVASLRRLACYRKLVLRERAGPSGRHLAVGLPRIRKPSDKPSDNGPRQHQTECDVLRHRYPLGLQ